jgi:membrane protein HdeD
MGRFLAKWIISSIIIVPLLLWFTEATFWGAFITASGLCILSYLVGDLGILRVSNNTIATLADAGLALAWFWIIADFNDWSLTGGELITLTIAVALFEAVFHATMFAPRRAR